MIDSGAVPASHLPSLQDLPKARSAVGNVRGARTSEQQAPHVKNGLATMNEAPTTSQGLLRSIREDRLSIRWNDSYSATPR